MRQPFIEVSRERAIEAGVNPLAVVTRDAAQASSYRKTATRLCGYTADADPPRGEDTDAPVHVDPFMKLILEFITRY